MRRLTRKLFVGSALALALIVVLPVALAGAGSGKITVGNPAGFFARGVTEAEFVGTGATGRCVGIPKTQGIDGYVINLEGNPALHLTSSSSTPYQLSIVFYNEYCNTVVAYHQTTSYGPALVPTGSKWVVVNAIYGADIALSFNAYNPFG